MWVAKYRGDSRAIDKEAERQETRAQTKPYSMDDALTHSHHQEAAPVTVPTE